MKRSIEVDVLGEVRRAQRILRRVVRCLEARERVERKAGVRRKEEFEQRLTERERADAWEPSQADLAEQA